MARDLIGERAAQLAANRAKPTVPFLPDLGYERLPNTPCRGAESPTYRRALWQQGERLWREAGYTKEQFEQHLRDFNALRKKGD
jgi:hypothetical protein